MGVSHSMDDGQVVRISKALKDSAHAIQGINNKFDDIDKQVTKMNHFNDQMNSRVQGTLQSFQRLDDTFNERAELALEALIGTSENLEMLIESTVVQLQQINVRKQLDQLPKAVIPLAIPLIVLLIELAVANAYMGILLASLPTVKQKYSEYLLINASSMLLGLTLSLLWLFLYRAWLSLSCSKSPSNALDRLHRMRHEEVSDTDSVTSATLDVDDLDESLRASESEARMTPEQSQFSGSDVLKTRNGRPCDVTASPPRHPSDMQSDFVQKQITRLKQRRNSRLQKAERKQGRSPGQSPGEPLDLKASRSSSPDRSRSNSDQTDLHARAALASANLLAAVEDASALASTEISDLAGTESLALASGGRPARSAASSGQDEELQGQADCTCSPFGGRNSCQPVQSSGMPSQRNSEKQSQNKPYEYRWVDPLHMDVTWSGLGKRTAAAPPPDSSGRSNGIGQEADRGRSANVTASRSSVERSMSI
eukprot:TRINITY_DN18657_c0_g1_i1.p1 TRINITY_DN18657_c0_g1~~TRINITY_DN18657_c0_g1_i1.p1  ORF type:complete len:505 (+),score=71.12 TRINITY_DN18657_c0_g1_i1:71-1516(+)